MPQTLEERVETLEKLVADIERRPLQGKALSSKEALMRTFGRAKGDPHFQSAAQLGAAWREEENRRSLEELDARP